jgi:GrpB-like predicted nucleotidyltransferase (UPF0157 family)
MPPPIPVVLAAFDPTWARLADARAEQLRVLGGCLVGVHHIGSTSIAGLAAKPILDLMPLVRDLAVLDRERGRVESLGYAWHGENGISERRYCTLCDESGVRIVQLHCFRAGSPHATRHLAFRDYLRAHPDVVRAYEAEKRRAQKLHPDNSHAYGAAKSAWIQRTEAIALEWYAARNVARERFWRDSGR